LAKGKGGDWEACLEGFGGVAVREGIGGWGGKGGDGAELLCGAGLGVVVRGLWRNRVE